MAKSKRQSNQHSGEPCIRNRRARHDYLITDTLECGIRLKGTEVKSLRNGQASLQDRQVGDDHVFGALDEEASDVVGGLAADVVPLRSRTTTPASTTGRDEGNGE